MISTLKAVWGRNQRIVGNFFSLSVLQYASYVANLITLPYLTRVLDKPDFGLTEFAKAIALFFMAVTDYGFYLSATQEISVHREDPKRLSEVFSAVLVLKMGMLVLCVGILSAAVFGSGKLRPDWLVYFLAFAGVFGQCIFPVWLFQGMERMTYIAVLNVGARLLVTASVFIFVRQPRDYVYVPLLQSLGTILVGTMGLITALRVFPVRFELPSFSLLKREFVDGWHLFLSKMATTLYNMGNTIILGLLTNNDYVAYYAAGDKIVRAIQGLQLPLSQAVFPHVGKLAVESKTRALRFASKLVRLVGVVNLIFSIGLLVFAPVICRVVLGPKLPGSVPVVRILSFLPLIIGVSNIFGTQVMVNFGLKKDLTKVFMIAGLLNTLLALAIVIPLRHIGTAIAVTTTETFVTVAMYVVLRRHGLDILTLGANRKTHQVNSLEMPSDMTRDGG
jgi:PST family polysaccharide transporter